MVSLANKIGKKMPADFYSYLSVDDRNKAFATALAIYILQKHFESKKNEWKRIAIKGVKVLKKLGIDDK